MNDMTGANSIEERKKAKEAYMLSLANAKEKAVEAQASSNYSNTNKSQPNEQLSAAQKREKMLEEKRKNFFSKKIDSSSLSADSTSLEVNKYPISFGDDNHHQNNEAQRINVNKIEHLSLAPASAIKVQSNVLHHLIRTYVALKC